MFQRLRTKKIIFYAIILSLPFLFVEGLLRVYFSYRVGPRVLLYGTMFSRHQKKFDPDGSFRREIKTKRSVGFHDNTTGNYSKYYPYQQRVDHDESGNVFRVTINSQGFRGKDFEQPKQPGVIRIVTLGASSTFGFNNRDNETYPFYLEERLNAALPDLNAQRATQSYKPIQAFEVINFGIPHLTTDQIYSLLMAEALALEPDIVTFYEGINDAWVMTHTFVDEKENPVQWESKLKLGERLYNELRYRLLSIAYADLLISRYLKALEVSIHEFDAHLQDRKGTFVENIQRMYEECQKREILFIAANQQAKSYDVPKPKMKGLTYAQEKAKVREKWDTAATLKARDRVPTWQLRAMLYFLTHSVLMEELQNWVNAQHLPFVDVISAMDLNRQNLVSWVHLTPQGNRIISSAFTEEILKQMRDRHILAHD